MRNPIIHTHEPTLQNVLYEILGREPTVKEYIDAFDTVRSIIMEVKILA